MADEQFRRTILTAEHFLCQSCAIYGASGGGKTTIIKHILYLIRSYVTCAIVFSRSEKDNGNYSRYLVPRILVHDVVTEDVLKRIESRQTKAKQVYDTVNNVEVLQHLFARCASPPQRAMFEKIVRTFEDFKRQRPEGADEETERVYNEKRVAFLRAAIQPRLAMLESAQDLDDREKFSLRLFQFNPRIVIVFDDCSNDIKRLKNCDTALDLIFRGRHSMCTTILAIHSEAFALPPMRANINRSIFTDPQTARIFADRESNGFPKEKRDEIVKYANRILKCAAPYTKMLFDADLPSLITVEPHGPFSVVSDAVRKWADASSSRSSTELAPWMKQLI